MLGLFFWVCDNIMRKILNTSKQFLSYNHSFGEKKNTVWMWKYSASISCFLPMLLWYRSSHSLLSWFIHIYSGELKVHLVQTILGDCWNSGKMDQECSGECYFEWSVFYSDKVFLQMESATIQDYVAVMAAHVATASWSNLLDHFLNPLYIL